MKKVLFLILIFFCTAVQSFPKSGTIVTYTIDAEKNAYIHNNKGIEYASEKLYYAAIQEFKIAISLNPKKQSTAVYFNNLGKVYMTIGYPQLALDCFENALIQYPMNLEYYKNLAQCYEVLGISDKKLGEYSNSDKPYDVIMKGVLLAQSGNIRRAIITLDEFSSKEPDILITPAIKIYIEELTKELDK